MSNPKDVDLTMTSFSYVTLVLKSVKNKNASIMNILINSGPKRDLCDSSKIVATAAFYFVRLVVVY